MERQEALLQHEGTHQLALLGVEPGAHFWASNEQKIIVLICVGNAFHTDC